MAKVYGFGSIISLISIIMTFWGLIFINQLPVPHKILPEENMVHYYTFFCCILSMSSDNRNISFLIFQW